MHTRLPISILLLSSLLLCSCTQRRGPGPLSPPEALRTFRLNEDFRIELFAAEPYVMDPVEIAFDERGRAFVAEMLDLPDDPPAGKSPRSRIRMLVDEDGDGRVDQATVFADKLLQVTSVLPWKEGLLVAAAPDILYLRDNDGDGRADLRRVLFTGFAIVNPESRITNLRYGIDNWVYASNNGQRGMITYRDRPEAPPVNVLGADFRFRLDRGLFEAESGPTQFGQAMNDWGHRFITQNTVHVRHVILPRRYLNRSPFLSAGDVSFDISDHGKPSVPIFPLTKPQYWREVRTKMRQQRYSENQLDRTEHAGGYSTGAAGGTIYCGDAFPEKYRGNLFTGDVSANLVHRDILRPDGVTYTASRPPEEQTREFLASTDPWFRPCNFATGPDGCLYVVDMYREFIETPESIPEELKKEMNFYSGDTMGRIYRIVPKNSASHPSSRVDLRGATGQDLVGLLGHANGWWRIQAQRLLVERQDASVVPMLREEALRGKSAQSRLHALYSLEGLSALDADAVRAALEDPEPGIREHAVRLAESFPALLPQLLSMTEDTSPRVQFQLTLSLGQFVGSTADAPSSVVDPPKSAELLGAMTRLISRHPEDRWFRIAALSSASGSSVSILESLAGQNFFREPLTGKERFLEDLSAIVGIRQNREEISSLMNLLLRNPSLGAAVWQSASLTGLARGLKVAGTARLDIPSAEPLMRRALTSASEALQTAARTVSRHLSLKALMGSARREALDPALPSRRRASAIYALGGAGFEENRPVYEKLLMPPMDPDLFRAAVLSLHSSDDPGVADLLISRWSNLGPDERNLVLDALLSHTRRVPAMLAAIEKGLIEPAALDLPRREKLLGNPDEEVSQRARALFHADRAERRRLAEQYAAAQREAGDALRGKAVFEKNCAACHMPRRGRRIGPDLSGVSSRTRAQLLQDILDPSRSIDPGYTNYALITKDGRILDGLIAGESPGTLTLRPSNGEDETILRSNIKAIRASSLSLMPDGLEQAMTRTDVADLIAYLQGRNLMPSK